MKGTSIHSGLAYQYAKVPFFSQCPCFLVFYAYWEREGPRFTSRSIWERWDLPSPRAGAEGRGRGARFSISGSRALRDRPGAAMGPGPAHHAIRNTTATLHLSAGITIKICQRPEEGVFPLLSPHPTPTPRLSWQIESPP